jgi:hypothetical protein
MRVVKKRKADEQQAGGGSRGEAQCCLLTALGDKAWPRAPSPDADMSGSVLPPKAVATAAAVDVEMCGKACEDKGKAAGEVATEVTPNKEGPLSRSRDLPTPSTDHRGIKKDRLLRKDTCTDQSYNQHKGPRFCITISNTYTRRVDSSTTSLLHQYCPDPPVSKCV